MAVTIRMKMMGRKHRPFFRICAVDSRRPRDGRVLEELGTYDPLVPDVDARVLLNGERMKPSHEVRIGDRLTLTGESRRRTLEILELPQRSLSKEAAKAMVREVADG